MRPVLKAGLRRLWRPGGTLQVGVTPGRSLLLNGIGPEAARFVTSLDGMRDIPGLLDHADAIGVPGSQAAMLLDVLARAGFLDDAGYDPGSALRGLDVAEADRLAPDMASLALGYLVPGGAVRAMTRRRNAVIAVYGCGRVGASVANMLAAAGVGCVVPMDAGKARAADAAPGGYLNPQKMSARNERDLPGQRRGGRSGHDDVPEASPASERSRRGNVPEASAGGDHDAEDREAAKTARHPETRQDLVRDLIRATSPSVRTTLPANRQHPDLAILAPIADAHPALADTLHAAGVPHLAAEIHETTGVLGPFVQPGRTSCLRCRDLHRTARDPGWPRALVPFGGVDAVPAGEDRACDVVLATQLGLLAAMHALAFVEGDPPPSVEAAIDVTLPYGAQSTHERPPHPECGCGADRQFVTGNSPDGSNTVPVRHRSA